MCSLILDAIQVAFSGAQQQGGSDRKSRAEHNLVKMSLKDIWAL